MTGISKRCYGANGEDKAPSSLDTTDRDAPCRSQMTPACAGAGLYGAFDCQVAFLPDQSVAAVAARWLDRLKVLEVELGDGPQLIGRARSFEVVRDVVEPGAVFLPQTDQGGRCGPACWPRGDVPDRCRG